MSWGRTKPHASQIGVDAAAFRANVLNVKRAAARTLPPYDVNSRYRQRENKRQKDKKHRHIYWNLQASSLEPVMSLRKLWAFIQLTRPVFLVGGALLYNLGIAIAASQGVAIDRGRALLGQWMVSHAGHGAVCQRILRPRRRQAPRGKANAL